MNHEQLSALMDGELTGEVTRQAVTELLAEPEARATWARYHLLGDALRAAAEQAVTGIESRPQTGKVVPFPTPERRPVSRAGLGLAAAAALAAVVLIVAKPAPQNAGAANNIAMTTHLDSAKIMARQQTAAEEARVANETTSSFGATSISQTDMIREDEAQKRMNTYLINFNEQRARQRTPGVHPYVRIVGYDTH